MATTDFWPRPTLATTCFGHDLLWPRSVLGIFEAEEGGGAKKGWGPKPRKRVRARKVGGPKGKGPKFSSFFFLLPPPFFLFSSLRGSSRVFFLSPGVFSCFFFSLWGSSRGILVVFWSVRTLKCACFRLRVVLWKPPTACRSPATNYINRRERFCHKWKGEGSMLPVSLPLTQEGKRGLREGLRGA